MKSMTDSTTRSRKGIGDFFRAKVAGWICAAAMLGALVVVVLVYSESTRRAHESAATSIEISKQAFDLVGEVSNTIKRYNDRTANRDNFFFRGSEIIQRHYVDRSVPENRRMTPEEIMTFLSTIYDYVETNQYLGVDYYLPLAFAAHESDFIPTAKGAAGEDGLFQFMEATAIEVMRQMNEPYTEGCAKDVATSTRMWFAHYRYLCNLFVGHPEMHGLAALAYNRGYGRLLRTSYLRGLTVEQHIKHNIVEYNDYHYMIGGYYEKFVADSM